MKNNIIQSIRTQAHNKHASLSRLKPLAAALLAATVSQSQIGYAEAIEEVIVTAQKRAQSMQDVGIAVTAFNSEHLKELGISQAIDLAGQTPGLDIKNTVGNSNPVITIRGVGLNDYNTNNSPSAAVHVDEVYLGSNGYLGFQLFDIAQVEVLKGPQGTLFGRNTTAGSVNFITRKPSQEFEANLDASYGNFNTRKLEAGVGGPLTDSLSARFAVMTKNAEGHLDAQATPSSAVGFNPMPGIADPLKAYGGDDSLGDTDTSAWRLSLAWEPSDKFDATLSLHGSRDKSELWVPSQVQDHNFVAGATAATLPVIQAVNSGFSGNAAIPFPVLAQTQFTIPANADEYDVYVNETPEVDARQFGASLKANWEMDFATLTSVTGYEKLDRDQSYQSGSPLRIYNTPFSDDMSQVTQELRLTGENGDDNWVVGAFWMQEDLDFNKQASLVDVVLDATALIYDLAGAPGVPAGESYILPVTSYGDIDYTQEGESWALFGQYEWQVNDTWKVTAGLRYTEEEKTFVGGTKAVHVVDGVPSLLALQFPDLPIEADEKYETDDISGKIAVDWTPNDDLLIYASYSKGFKSGGFDGSTVLQEVALEPFTEETLWATEIGFKSSLLDGSLQLNGAIYHYDFEDMQASVTVDLGGGNTESLRRNAGKAEIIGGELELWWKPTERWDIRAGVAVLDGEIKKFDSADPAESAFYEGNKVPDAPETTFNAVARYEWPLRDNLLLSASVDVNYSDEIYKDLDNTELTKAGSYTLWGGRLALGTQDENWEVYLWGKNLTDETYQLNAGLDPHGVTAYYNMPRTYGVGLVYNWQ